MVLHGLKIKAIKTAGVFAMVIGLLIVMSVQASEGGPKYGAMNLSDNGKGDSPTLLFAADVPEIYLDVELIDIVGGETLTATWIAEKTDTARPNSKIDSADVIVDASMNDAKFSVHRPSAGWPIGDYRVEMAINGQSASSVHFKIVK